MPRAKFTKPPGPFSAIKYLKRSKFRFRRDQWRELTNLLPPKLGDLSVPATEYADEAKKLQHQPRWALKTVADVLIHETEGAIASYLTMLPFTSEGQNNPANVRAAIRRVRKALEPFVRGWVDNETADLIPADLDDRLAARERAIAGLRLPSARQRALVMLCQTIGVVLRNVASANGQAICDKEVIDYLDAALTYASIAHPDVRKHRARLAALVFPKE